MGGIDYNGGHLIVSIAARSSDGQFTSSQAIATQLAQQLTKQQQTSPGHQSPARGEGIAQSLALRDVTWPPRCTGDPGVAGLKRNGETRNRTGDTTIFSRVLYQLSYLAEQLSDGSGAHTLEGYALSSWKPP
jgi:hypothetical protein